mmetsp:Transcript_6025/g.13029  ORF Transcript_6025/g.13029 Transcript_6025/m.13029 type:complete len:212 (-) Transcript_6025:79-714(-)
MLRPLRALRAFGKGAGTRRPPEVHHCPLGSRDHRSGASLRHSSASTACGGHRRRHHRGPDELWPSWLQDRRVWQVLGGPAVRKPFWRQQVRLETAQDCYGFHRVHGTEGEAERTGSFPQCPRRPAQAGQVGKLGVAELQGHVALRVFATASVRHSPRHALRPAFHALWKARWHVGRGSKRWSVCSPFRAPHARYALAPTLRGGQGKGPRNG